MHLIYHHLCPTTSMPRIPQQCRQPRNPLILRISFSAEFYRLDCSAMNSIGQKKSINLTKLVLLRLHFSCVVRKLQNDAWILVLWYTYSPWLQHWLVSCQRKLAFRSICFEVDCCVRFRTFAVMHIQTFNTKIRKQTTCRFRIWIWRSEFERILNQKDFVTHMTCDEEVSKTSHWKRSALSN